MHVNAIVKRIQPLKKMWFTAAVLDLFGTRDQFRGRQFFHGRDGGGGDASGGNVSNGTGGNASNDWGSNVSNGERWGAADEALPTVLPLTSCCAVQFLPGDPWFSATKTNQNQKIHT